MAEDLPAFGQNMACWRWNPSNAVKRSGGPHACVQACKWNFNPQAPPTQIVQNLPSSCSWSGLKTLGKIVLVGWRCANFWAKYVVGDGSPWMQGKRSGGPHAYIYIQMHVVTYIHTYIHTHIHTYIYVYTLVRTSHSVGLSQSAQRGWFAPLLERKKQLRYLWAKGAGSAAGQATGRARKCICFLVRSHDPIVSPCVDDFPTTCPIALMIKSPSFLSPWIQCYSRHENPKTMLKSWRPTKKSRPQFHHRTTILETRMTTSFWRIAMYIYIMYIRWSSQDIPICRLVVSLHFSVLRQTPINIAGQIHRLAFINGIFRSAVKIYIYNSYVLSLSQSVAHSLTHSLTHSFIQSVSQSVAHSLTHSLIHSFIHFVLILKRRLGVTAVRCFVLLSRLLYIFFKT